MIKTLKKLFLLAYVLGIVFSVWAQTMAQNTIQVSNGNTNPTAAEMAKNLWTTPTKPATNSCPDWIIQDWVCVVNNYWNMGIECSQDQLINWQCKLNIYKTVGIREWNENQDPKSFIQDIINWATMFIWTVVTIALVYSGFMYVYAGSTGEETSKYKKWIMKSLVGILIVGSSYAIIRLIQFLAKGW